MPVKINHTYYYRTSEACRLAGISRSTLLRWLKEGCLLIQEYRDRRGWRLFTKDDVASLREEANRLSKIHPQKWKGEIIRLGKWIFYSITINNWINAFFIGHRKETLEQLYGYIRLYCGEPLVVLSVKWILLLLFKSPSFINFLYHLKSWTRCTKK